jgi:excisionase family DNA binding protein
MGEITVYTIKDAAELLKTEHQTVLNEIEKGNIEAFKIGGEWRVTEQSILSFISGGGSELEGPRTAGKRSSNLKINESAPFQYTWPNGYTEDYPVAYEGTIDKDDMHFEIKIGVGDREAAGKERKRVTVFLNGRPTVEFAGANDFDQSKLIASVITLPNKKRLRPYQPVPKEYQSFDVRRYDSVIKGPRAATTMAVVSKIDDLETIVSHAVNRAIYRDSM